MTLRRTDKKFKAKKTLSVEDFISPAKSISITWDVFMQENVFI